MAGIGPVDGSGGWARRLWDMLAEDGVYGIPRTGLLFAKRGRELVLIERFPWEQGMPGTPEELHEAQQADLEGMRNVMSAIGVVVSDETVFTK